MQFLFRDGYVSMDFTVQLNTALQTDEKPMNFYKKQNNKKGKILCTTL